MVKASGPAGCRAFAALASVCLAAVLLGGCWDRIEVNNLNVVAAVAFDAAPGGRTRVTVSIVLPENIPTPAGSAGGGGGGHQKTIVVSMVGSTIGEAEAKLDTTIPGYLFWGDARVIVLGQDFARRGILPAIDFFLRQRNARVNTDVLITRGDAGPLLEAGPPYRAPSTDFIYTALRRHVGPVDYVYKVAGAHLMTSSAMLLPEVRVIVPQPAGSTAADGGSAKSLAQFQISGAGVIDRGRLVGWLDGKQARGALWLLGRVHPSRFVIHGPGGATLTSKEERASIHRRAVALPDGQVAIQIDISTDGFIEEVDHGSPALNDPAYLKALGESLARAVRQRAASALTAARTMGVDCFGFGHLVAAYEPAAWVRLRADWPRVFTRLPVILNVRAHIRATGGVLRLG